MSQHILEVTRAVCIPTNIHSVDAKFLEKTHIMLQLSKAVVFHKIATFEGKRAFFVRLVHDASHQELVKVSA
jgi:hypothetical protein